MRETNVVNVRTCDSFDVYIGRRFPRKKLPESPFSNPFVINRDGTRDEVIEKYRAYLMGRPDLLAMIPNLQGKTLACWCAPARCHGDVLAELADEMTNETPAAVERSACSRALLDAGLALLPVPTGISYTGIEIARMARVEKIGMQQRLRPAAAVVEAVKVAVRARRECVERISMD